MVTLEDCTAGLNEINSSESIFIYPNPAVSTIQLLGASENNQVLIYSLMGDLVAVYSNTTVIDISSIQAGNYLVKIEQKNITLTKRLIIRD
ncbi:MAG: hypothetical protein ACI9XB_004066 [Gammaproteobacteria bacterium]